MLKLNPLTGRKGASSEIPTSVTEEQFWRYYLMILMVRNSSLLLTFKEVEVLVFILSGNPDRSYFRGSEASLIKEHFRMKKPDLSKMKKSLVVKGFVVETGAVRGDALLINSLRKFQKYIKMAMSKNLLPPIVFNFAFNIEHGNNTEQEGRDNTDLRRDETTRRADRVYGEAVLEQHKAVSI